VNVKSLAFKETGHTVIIIHHNDWIHQFFLKVRVPARP